MKVKYIAIIVGIIIYGLLWRYSDFEGDFNLITNAFIFISVVAFFTLIAGGISWILDNWNKKL